MLDYFKAVMLAWLAMVSGIALAALAARMAPMHGDTIFLVGTMAALLVGCSVLVVLHFRWIKR